jgi:hypothetical protein
MTYDEAWNVALGKLDTIRQRMPERHGIHQNAVILDLLKNFLTHRIETRDKEAKPVQSNRPPMPNISSDHVYPQTSSSHLPEVIQQQPAEDIPDVTKLD